MSINLDLEPESPCPGIVLRPERSVDAATPWYGFVWSLLRERPSASSPIRFAYLVGPDSFLDANLHFLVVIMFLSSCMLSFSLPFWLSSELW